MTQIILFRNFFLTVLLLASGNTVSAQVYLYLEDMMQVKAIKIPQGASVSIKTIENPEWTNYQLQRLLPEDNVIIHPNGMINLNEITHLRMQRKWVTALGSSLQTFGVAWGVYGLIALASSTGTVELSVVAVGSLVPIAAGYIMKKLWKYKKYKINSKHRLKILDLSFPDDPYNEKQQKVKYYP